MCSLGNQTRSVGNHQVATFAGRYTNFAYKILADHMHAMSGLPTETLDQIFEEAGHIVWNELAGTRTYNQEVSARHIVFSRGGKASIPPANGSCPFFDLPAEVRRKILVDGLGVLPSRNRTIHPTCGAGIGTPSTLPNPPNQVANLMLISKKVRDEIAEIVYEERTFAIHVHQGFQNAGIEFLHVGRQPLQYLDHADDGRFVKCGTGEMFGFFRLKRIEVQIFPCDGTYHHTVTNTYFMNIALVRLLTRSTEKELDRITFIRLVFPEGSRLKPIAVSSWWDAGKDRPRETSIHGISDVELVLRPFAQLSRVHRVDVQLPTQVDRHVRSVKFVKSLVNCMTATTPQNAFNSDDLEHKIESARFALEDYIRKKLYGSTCPLYAHMPKITDEEIEDDKQSQEFGDDDEMDTTQQDDCSLDQHGSELGEDEATHMLDVEARCPTFDEDGGFQDDLDSLHVDVPVAPNPVSEKISRFVDCLPVTGDVARFYLRLCGDDLERAIQKYLETPDSNEVAASAFTSSHSPTDDGPATPENKHGKSSRHDGGSGERSGPSEVQPWNKNKKGKQRALFVAEDEDIFDGGKRGEDSDDDDSVFQSQLQKLQRQSRQFHSGPSTLQTRDGHASSSTLGATGNARGRVVKSNTSGGTSGMSIDTSGMRNPAPRSIVRRDSYVGLEAEYTVQGQQISPFRSYESPTSTTATQGSQDATQHRRNLSDNFSSPLRRPARRYGGMSTSGVSNPSSTQQSQQTGYLSANALEGSLQYAQPMYRNPVPSWSSQPRFASPALNPLADPFSSVSISSNYQQSSMREDYSTAHAYVPRAHLSYYTGGDGNASIPTAAPYPPSTFSAPAADEASLRLSLQGAAASTSTVPRSQLDGDMRFTNQLSRTSVDAATNNNISPPSLQQSGLGSNVEDMDVDAAEDSSPGGVPLDDEQMQDVGS